MAFLDNSGDIILDAVLTDAGRQRLARGNFKITKFALGDEEINYNVFNGSHPSGSAFYDLEIMQSPVLEAFTNNTSLMKSKLITMTRNNILYMPILKLNHRRGNFSQTTTALASDDNLNIGHGYVILADKNTEQNSNGSDFDLKAGLLRGAGTTIYPGDITRHIAIDQGIDSTEGGLSFRQPLPADLAETAFLIKMDHRLLTLSAIDSRMRSTTSITNQFVDDDGIATYYVVQGDGTTCVEGPPAGVRDAVVNDRRERDIILNDNPDSTQSSRTVGSFYERFPGPLGSILRMYPRTSMHVRQSTSLFDEFGTTVAAGNAGAITTSKEGAEGLINTGYQYIDTLINVVGVTTGYSFDVPIRIVKKS